MGDYRYYIPRCYLCYKKNWRKKELGLPYTWWGNIEFVRPHGYGAILRCRNCGHEYISYSRFAKTETRKFEKEKNAK